MEIVGGKLPRMEPVGILRWLFRINEIVRGLLAAPQAAL
jgi:hypothetical protein